MWRCLQSMNVEVVGKWMSQIEPHDLIKCRKNLVRAGLRLAFVGPLVPGAQIHHSLGKKRAGIGIIRVLFPNPTHRIGVGLIERTAILWLRVSITMAKRLDQCLFYRRSVRRVLSSETEFLPRQLGCSRRHQREVDMRSARESYPPMGHGAVRIYRLCRLDRANRSPMIKAEVEVKSLVKVFLCLRRVCRDLARVGT